ncbi:MAG: hypothetical protein HQK54_09780 [Oligoflexales bacterium]|nr:hypothetical protein [Oligoflexales bacterium]
MVRRVFGFVFKSIFFLSFSAAFMAGSGMSAGNGADVYDGELRFKHKIAGRYAHYDVVAYVEKVYLTEMRTLVISYGITDLTVDDDGRLIATDRYCHAAHKSNLPFTSEVPDSFTQAIVPRSTPVEIRNDGGVFSIWRPETPTPIGIKLENPDEPLPKNPKDPRISDDDHDGKPGVTVKIKMYGVLNTELYLARREIFAYGLSLTDRGNLEGYVSDHSEQLVVGSPFPLLRAQRSPTQHPDPKLSPMILVPVDESYDCEKVMKQRDTLFPPEPEVWK